MLPLFERFSRLRESLPHVPLGDWPTPVVEATRFAKRHGLASLHIKREDQSHASCGGNKVRGLEFLLGAARARDAKTLITFSSAGSHHICRTAFHARRFHINTVAVLVDQPPAEYVRANLLTGLSLGVKYIHANRLTVFPKTIRQRMKYSDGEGSPGMYIPPGGTSPLACVGHVNAALELARQVNAGLLPMPDYVYVAMGSLGTAAGLALGLKIARMPTRVVGVVVSYRWYATRGRLVRFARRTRRLLRRADPSVPYESIRRSDFDVVKTALGKGYAQPTEQGSKLADELFELEGLMADATYTAKTLDGMMQFIEGRKLHDKRHLFWLTYDSIPTPNVARSRVPDFLQKYFTDENGA